MKREIYRVGHFICNEYQSEVCFQCHFVFEIFPYKPLVSCFYSYIKMTSPMMFFLTSMNSFQSKSHMEDLLRGKGLDPITLGKEEESTHDNKYAK